MMHMKLDHRWKIGDPQRGLAQLLKSMFLGQWNRCFDLHKTSRSKSTNNIR